MGTNPFDPKNAQGGKIPQYEGLQEFPGQLLNSGLDQPQGGMQFRYGGLLTYEKPIVEFWGDIPIGPLSSQLLVAGRDLPRNCVGVRFINLIANVAVSVNGFPFRTVLNNDVFSGCEIRSLQVLTDATGACSIQPVGTGD